MTDVPAIPILNLYYLLAYAWERLDAKERTAEAGRIAGPDATDHLAGALVVAVERLFRQGFPRGYTERAEDTNRIAGRVDMGESVRRLLLRQAKAHCRFDEFLADIPPNRILRATLARVAGAENAVRSDTRQRARELLKRFSEVRPIQLDGGAFRALQMHRHWNDARFALILCELLVRHWLAEERPGSDRMPDYFRDERRMARLFEDFVLRFYHRETGGRFKVTREQVHWACAADESGEQEAIQRLLPVMKTDVSLASRDEHIVVECKYYTKILTSAGYPDSAELRRKLRGDHVRQVYAYLGNLRHRHPEKKLSGLLLYAQSEPIPTGTVYLKDGLNITVAALDLNRPWPDIHAELLNWVGACQSR